MKVLFEFGGWHSITNPDALKNFLRAVWSSQIHVHDKERAEGEDNRYQPFLQFDGDQVRANNYIGFIQSESELIEVYPKVFRHLQSPDRSWMLRHIFFWFDYCRKWRFPFNKSSIDQFEREIFPELIIYLMVSQFLEVVSSQPFIQYQRTQERSSTPKGRIHFPAYAGSSLVTGNHHILEYEHEPFLFDNTVNQTIKYCCRLLLSQTKLDENQRMLQETLFVLDEVQDRHVSAAEVSRIQLNPFFLDYTSVLEVCQSILNQQIYSSSPYELSQWCLLLPMEYIFEDFIAGFLEDHFCNEWIVEYQKSNAYLSQSPEAFLMQHDIFLTNRADTTRRVIIDTKYKLREITDEVKKGVSQGDLYQVVSYALRRGCTEVLLIYPNSTLDERADDLFNVQSEFRGKETVVIRAAEVPFWSNDHLEIESKLIEKFKRILA